jgi:zinc transporter 1/2/3
MAMSMEPSVWPTTDMSFLNDDNAQNVNLADVAGNDDFMAQVVCYLNQGGNDYDGSQGAHISAIFVVLVVSTAVTFFPVLATKQTKVKIPLYVYLFARYFGAGVIIATAFIQ